MNVLGLNLLLDSVRKAYYQQESKVDINYIDEIQEKAKNYTIISFDIFDTVLTRLFECPIDLFAYVESQLSDCGVNFPDYALLRFKAEQMARNTAKQQRDQEEITLDDIYNALSFLTPVNHNVLLQAKQLELDAELESIVPVVDNKYLLSQLKQQGKKIIFVSDMYLSKQFISRLLSQNHLDVCDNLYVSSDLMKTKHTGRIWVKILQDYPEQEILHIGDNNHADVEIPKRFAIETFHYNRLLSYHRVGAQLSPNLVPFSLMSKMYYLMQYINEKDTREIAFWTKLGETLGAFILQSFIEWLKENIVINKIDHIYFCARDAQIIQKIWNYYQYDDQCNTTSSYLYLSRKVLRFPACYIELIDHGCLSDASLTFLVDESIQWGDSYYTYFKRLGLNEEQIARTNFHHQFGSLKQKIDFKNLPNIKFFLQKELISILTPIFYEKYQTTMAYLQQEGLFDSNKKIAIVDLGWGGTIQLALTELLEHRKITHKLYGYYYGLLNKHTPGRLFKNGFMNSAFFNMFWRPDEQFLIENSVNILENLHSADHETTIDFVYNSISNRYEPLFKEDLNKKYKRQYNQKFAVFQNGIMNTIKKWKNNQLVYGIGSDWIKPYFATAAILQVCISPNPDEQKYLGSIKHAALHDHSVFYNLINTEIPKNKSEIAKLLYSGGWPCGVMSYWNLQKNVFSEEIYQTAIKHFGHYPSLIKDYLIG